MQTASGYTLYYTPVPCHYAFAPCLCMHTPVVYSGIMAFTLYIYDAPNKLADSAGHRFDTNLQNLGLRQ